MITNNLPASSNELMGVVVASFPASELTTLIASPGTPAGGDADPEDEEDEEDDKSGAETLKLAETRFSALLDASSIGKAIPYLDCFIR